MIFSSRKNIIPFNSNQKYSLNTNCWVRSPAWDIFWLQSGLWLSLLMFSFKNHPAMEMFYMVGVFLFWISHRISPFYIAWGTRSYGIVRKKQPWRFVIFPVILVMSVFFLIFVPESIFPLEVSFRILGLLILDFFWGMHHFSSQHYGMLRLFKLRENTPTTNTSQRLDRFFCWVTAFVLVLIAELLHGASFLQQNQILPTIPYDWFNEIIPNILRLGTLLVLGITAFMIRNAMLKNSGLPRILYILGLGIMVTGAFQLKPIEFLMLWTLQHWITAIGLAAQMGGNDIKKSIIMKNIIFKKFSFTKYQNQWIVLLFLCSISVILTPFFEIEAVTSGARYSELVFPSLMYWLENSFLLKFLIGIGIASGFLHYFMDRAVYRLSDADTRMSANNLLFN